MLQREKRERKREEGILVTYNGGVTIIATAVVATDTHITNRSNKGFGDGLRVGNGSGYGDDGSHG